MARGKGRLKKKNWFSLWRLLLYILFLVVPYTVSAAGILNNLKEWIRNSIAAIDRTILDNSWCTERLYYFVVYSVFMLPLTIITVYARKIFYKPIVIRDKYFIRDMMYSDSEDEPVSDRERLIQRILGDKATDDQDRQMIDLLIDNNVAPIRDYLNNPASRVLMIDAPWGSGKTTYLLLAINECEAQAARTRFIYESAFKYDGIGYEFMRDLLGCLEETFSELEVNMSRLINSIGTNLDSEPKRTIWDLLTSDNSEKILSSELIAKLNIKLEDKNIRIYIIIDDLDRLRGNDIEKALALLSNLRRINCLRIVIPADLEVIQRSLENSGVVDSARFTEKYLPSANCVKLASNYDMAISVALRKILPNNNPHSYGMDGVNPAMAAVFMRLLTDKMRELTSGFNNYEDNWFWSKITKDNTELDRADDKILAILRIPEIINSKISNKKFSYSWSYEDCDVRHVYNVAYALSVYHSGTPGSREAREDFIDEDYNYAIRSWIFEYMNKNWDYLGFSIRDILNLVKTINFEKLPQQMTEQFVYIFNQVFPNNRLNMQKTKKKKKLSTLAT